jgi:HSP20 family protein
MLPVLRNSSVLAPFAAGPINRLDSLFDRFFGDDGGVTSPSWPSLPVALWEDEDRVYLEADMPGMAESDVEVTFHNGTLFIRGERKLEEGRRYVYNGRPYGRFERAITLPEAIGDGVQATLANGVLRVELPRRPEAKPKTIAVKTA